MDESRTDRLAQDGLPPPEVLDTWAAPEPSGALTHDILAGVTDVLTELAQPDPEPEPVPMLLPPPASLTSGRSPALPICVGFVIAAAVLLAFVLGRESATPAPGTQLEVHVANPPGGVSIPGPATAPTPPAPPAPPSAVGPPSAPPAPLAPRSTPLRANTSWLRIIAEPQEQPVRVRLDAVKLRDPTGGRIEIEPGRHRLQFAMPDGSRWTRTFQVAPGQTENIRVAHRQEDDTASTGLLRIGTTPGTPPAVVELDGAEIGTTPLGGLLVEKGTHTVQFEWPEYGSLDIVEVEVEPGKAVTLNGHL